MHIFTADLSLLLNYEVVVFYTCYRHVIPEEREALYAYLASGGNLIVTGYDCLVSDSLLADIVRSSTYGDNTGEPDLYVVESTHRIMNGPYGSFPTGYYISDLFSDCDAAEADTSRGAITVAELADGYDKIIATDLLPGKVVFWNGRGDADWTWNLDCQAMLKNMLHWMTVQQGDLRDLALTEITTSENEVYEGSIVQVVVTSVNLGNVSETYDVTLHYGDDPIETQTITNLAPNEEIVLTFNWNTSGVPLYANYTIWARASPVPGEMDIVNNLLVNGAVNVKILGDANCDCVIDILDIIVLARSYGCELGDLNWNSDADMNCDCLVDILDAIIMAGNFGQRWS